MTPLQDFTLNTRIKLAALWTSVMLLYIYGDYFALYIPGQAGKLVSGDTLLNQPLKVFAASVLMALPPLAIMLSVMARPTLVRWVNIVFGAFFTAIMMFIAITSFGPDYDFAWTAYVFYALLESIVTSIIVRQAWKWPRKDH